MLAKTLYIESPFSFGNNVVSNGICRDSTCYLQSRDPKFTGLNMRPRRRFVQQKDHANILYMPSASS